MKDNTVIKTFEEMQDDIIKKYGFESSQTILFCSMCEMEEQGIVLTVKANDFYYLLMN